MADRLLQTLVHAVRRTAAAAAAGAGDAELLQRFLDQRDPSAFELLVWRHGAMVESVCRRVLGASPDVDDAFQATFLALLRQAGSIRRQASLAGWLHRVALLVARRAGRAAAQRRRREQAAARPDLAADAAWSDLGPVLHEEIDRLPAPFRLAFVSCQLEGRTVDEAARLFGLPRGTVLSRLARARERLRRSLIRRGITPAVATAALAESESSVSAALVAAAVRTIHEVSQGAAVAGPVAGLAQGVIHDMMLSKVKFAAGVVLALGLLGAGGVLVSQPGAQARPGDEPRLTDKPAGRAEQKPAGDLGRMQGTWKIDSLRVEGKEAGPEGATVTITGDRLVFRKRPDGKAEELRIRLDPAARPPAIDMIDGTDMMPGIYELKGDSLRLCVRERGTDRPTKFGDTSAGAVIIELTRPAKAGVPGPAGARRTPDEQVEELRRQLAAERDRLRQAEVQLRRATAEAEAARLEAVAQRQRAEDERAKAEKALEAARAEAVQQRRLAEAERARAEKALQEARAVMDHFRKEFEKSKEKKP